MYLPADDQSVLVNGVLRDDFDVIIDCRGIGADQEWRDPTHRLRGVRGEVIRVKAPEVNLSRPVRLMHPRHPLYVVPKPDDIYVVGATEIESASNHCVTVRSALELLSTLYTVHTGFAEAEILSMQRALRPTLSNNDPSILIQGNLIQVNGLYRHGYLIAPALLQQVGQLLLSDNIVGLGAVPTFPDLISGH